MEQFYKNLNQDARTGLNRIMNTCTDTADTSQMIIATDLKATDVTIQSDTSESRINTGINSLDELFSEEQRGGSYATGFLKQDILIISGMANIGKTSLAFTIFANLYTQNIPVIFFSLDMRDNRVKTVLRKTIMGCNAHEEEYQKRLTAYGRQPHLVSRQGTMTTKELDNYLTMYPANVVIIDYIDKLHPVKYAFRDDKANNINLFLELKPLATKHDCAIIILSQGTEDKSYKSGRPTLTNLYGGKEVRSEVDHVIAVYRNAKYNDNLPDKFKTVSEIMGLKLRSDSRNTIAYLNYQNYKMVDMNPTDIVEYRVSLANKNK